MAAPTSSKERLARLAILGVAALAGATLAGSAASGTLDGRGATPVGGFAGPVAGPPRAIERDLDDAPGSLQQVPCAAGAQATRCWVSKP